MQNHRLFPTGVRVFLYVFNEGDWKRYNANEFSLLPGRYISIKGSDPFPIEDINFLLTSDDLTMSEAFERWYLCNRLYR